MRPRSIRRAAERTQRKLARKAVKSELSTQTSELSIPIPLTRAEINRANAEHSTGPRSTTGKLASSRNSLKHGLASGELIIPGEDPAAFESLLHDLVEEHQPATPTEELLVREMAQSYWLTQRALRLQNDCFTDQDVDEKRLALFLRYQTTHERAFHKALNMLIRLRKECTRRFVSQNRPHGSSERGFVSQNRPEPPEIPVQTAPESQFILHNSLMEAA